MIVIAHYRTAFMVGRNSNSDRGLFGTKTFNAYFRQILIKGLQTQLICLLCLQFWGSMNVIWKPKPKPNEKKYGVLLRRFDS